MTSTHTPPLTATTLTAALGRCLDEFDLLESLCAQCETKPDMLVAQHLMISACDLAIFVVDSIASIALLGRIPVAHACIENACSPPGHPGGFGTTDTRAKSPDRIAEAIDPLFAAAEALRNAVRSLETTTSKPIPRNLAIRNIRRLIHLASLLKTLADQFVATWPSDIDELDLNGLATSPTLVSEALTAARAVMAIRHGAQCDESSLPDRLDDALCRIADLAGTPSLAPVFRFAAQ